MGDITRYEFDREIYEGQAALVKLDHFLTEHQKEGKSYPTLLVEIRYADTQNERDTFHVRWEAYPIGEETILRFYVGPIFIDPNKKVTPFDNGVYGFVGPWMLIEGVPYLLPLIRKIVTRAGFRRES